MWIEGVHRGRVGVRIRVTFGFTVTVMVTVRVSIRIRVKFGGMGKVRARLWVGLRFRLALFLSPGRWFGSSKLAISGCWRKPSHVIVVPPAGISETCKRSLSIRDTAVLAADVEKCSTANDASAMLIIPMYLWICEQ